MWDCGSESSALFITAGKLPEESEARPRGRGTRRRRRGHAGRGTFCDAAMATAAHCSLLISLSVLLSLSCEGLLISVLTADLSV